MPTRKPPLTLRIAARSLGGRVAAQWQPMPGATPAASAYRGSLNCTGEVIQAGFEHPLPWPAIGLLAALNTPQGREHVAAEEQARRECMARQGWHSA